MTHHAIVEKAADAIEAYHAWDARTRGPLAEFNRRAKVLGGKAAPERGEKAALMRERRAYLAANPQPRTADTIIDAYVDGDMRLYGIICGEVTAEVERRAAREAA